ncbi:MAG TPA: hypothetical protein V6D50_07660 [Chroococcales cyanobacterium]
MNDFQLYALKPHYEQLFATCQIRSSWLEHLARAAETIVNLRSHYYAEIERQTFVPWWFVGILHYRDLGFRDAHLYNGDPLTNRTVREPINRPEALPANGIAYTFVESAVDALRWKLFDPTQDRSIAAWLWRFESWNGWNYALRGLNSEYLWNGTNHFGSGNNRGKFVADNIFDPNARVEQVGAAALLWYFYYKGLIDTGLQEVSGAANPTSSTPVEPAFSTPAFTSNPYAGQLLGANTATLQRQDTLLLLDALNYYQRLPQQDLAIAWLQQQISVDLLAEFARRWRENPTVVGIPTVQQMATTSVPMMPETIQADAPPSAPPVQESLNQAIVSAASSLRGASSAQGPDGGRNACAWMLNRVLQRAGMPALGANPNLVSSLVEALKGGRGQLIERSQAKAGDLVVAHGNAHIGVGIAEGCQRVLSNSSSKARFSWESGIDFDGYYRGSSTIYRLLR